MKPPKFDVGNATMARISDVTPVRIRVSPPRHVSRPHTMSSTPMSSVDTPDSDEMLISSPWTSKVR